MAQQTPTERFLRWFPVLALAAGVIASAAAGQNQLNNMGEKLDAQAEELEDLDDLVRKLEDNDIRTEGQLKLEVQRLNSNIANQSAKIDQLLQLLREGR